MSRSIDLSGTQFSTLNSAGINDPEGPEKYNNTEVKYGANFYSCHTALDTCCCKTQLSTERIYNITFRYYNILEITCNDILVNYW
jgi:hypothetical protein